MALCKPDGTPLTDSEYHEVVQISVRVFGRLKSERRAYLTPEEKTRIESLGGEEEPFLKSIHNEWQRSTV
jgi:hypothetical protein